MNKTTPKVNQIPTLSDIIRQADARFLGSVEDGEKDEVLFGEIANILTAPIGKAGMVDMLLCARGCHEVARVLARRGDPLAGLYFAIAQDLIAKSVESVGALEAAWIADAGLSRH